MLKKFFSHRYGPLAVLCLLVVGISMATRIILLIKAWPMLQLSVVSTIGLFGMGLFYDIIVWSFFAIPVALYCWWMKDSWYRSRLQRIGLLTLFFILIVILVLNAGAEMVFWDEFGVRYNFIAVDYLVYTNEVLANIWQSYNIPLILSAVLALSTVLLWWVRKPLLQSQQVITRFGKRSVFFFAFLCIPAAGYFLVKNSYKNISKNNFVNELSGNGIYEFGHAYWQNEIEYKRFYATRRDEDNFRILRQMLQAPGVTFTGDSLSVERQITYPRPGQERNIVLISVESLSGDYLGYFGNTESITPYLDSLIPHSIFFTRFYASGTRTVRGLEALSLAIPPTPGQSIIRRPDNEDMFTLGNVLGQKGYEVKYIYGGNSFFDNMGYFFSHSGYQVTDQRDIPDSIVHHTTVWGVCDEDIFTQTLRECDASLARGKHFFNHVMTVSNHRPYTYPEGRIDIPPASNTIQGAVKYTDFAINGFLQAARSKPWFANTIFVIVADHCSKSAGKTDLPLNRYHIPCLIYAPEIVQPAKETRLTSQIDLAPSLLGLMQLSYTSRFLGYDIFNTPAGKERLFVSTYQGLGYLRDSQLVILSPHQKIATYQPDFVTGINTSIRITDSSLIREAIAWYQGASYLFGHSGYKIK
jgi:phosphoglycerol transferase MdoB-like AlkP superfamily enzyme